MATSLYLDRMEFLLIGLFRIESELRSHCNIFGPIRRTEIGHAFDEVRARFLMTLTPRISFEESKLKWK